MPNDDTPPDSDLLGLYVTGIAGLFVIAMLLAFFLIGPVAGIIVLLAGGALGTFAAYKRLGGGKDS